MHIGRAAKSIGGVSKEHPMTPEEEAQLYEQIDFDQQWPEVWLWGDATLRRGCTADLKPLVGGKWAYRLSYHHGDIYTSSHPIQGPYDQPYLAIRAAIEEFERRR